MPGEWQPVMHLFVFMQPHPNASDQGYTAGAGAEPSTQGAFPGAPATALPQVCEAVD